MNRPEIHDPGSGGQSGHDAAIAEFARRHWLLPTRLDALPDAFTATRDALHQLAFFAVAPKRYAYADRLGLRWSRGGFGTPFYETPDGAEQVRMEGDLLVLQTGRDVRSIRPSTLAEATEFLGIPYRVEWFPDFHDPLSPWDADRDLTIDADAAQALANWFGFGTFVLEHLRRIDGATEVSEVQLWPEHFDPAAELGDADKGQRASYGASPGDAAHGAPYLYVSPWDKIDRSDEYWNDEAFGGASLDHAALVEADDPLALALEFFIRGHELLTYG